MPNRSCSVSFDEGAARRVRSEETRTAPVGHDCHTAPELGLAGKKNGELLSIAEARGFEVFVSLDQGFEYQQNLRNRNLGVVLIRSRSNTLSSLIGDVGEILSAIETIQPGVLIKVPG